MNRVQGKVAVVTGAGRYVGRATSLVLAREGANVAVLDVNEAAAQELAAEIREGGGKAEHWLLDVAREADVARVFAEVSARFGRFDILVNNADVGGTHNPTEDVSEAQWDAVMAVNVKGVFFCTKHAVPHMRAAGGGSIINVSSIYGVIGSPNDAPFHASKGAVRIMTKTDALAYAADGIRVNAVLPGFIWNPIDGSEADPIAVAPEMARNAMAEMHPYGTLGEPEDVAYGILYLASDEAKFVTGAALVIDGGYTAR